MPELHFLNALDYTILGGYMVMIVAIGLYVARFNKKTTDYFKGGGHIPWQLSMVSLFISGFSAFMFVGASGITYQNGGGAILLFSLALPAYLIGYFFFAVLWRRTRLDTPLQFLTRRFSRETTYFYTLLAVIPNTLVLGIMIYTLCIFTSTALGISEQVFDLGLFTIKGFELSILITGGVIVIYTTLGGLWAVMVTDGIQFLIVLLVTLIITPLSYSYIGDGNLIEGLKRMASDTPEGYFSINLEGKPLLFWPVYFVYIVFGYNVNWHIAQRYYSVADERDTRKMALWCAGLSFVLPMLWILPIFTTPIIFPDIASLWPSLTNPEEASFVTLALAVLPHGMLGLLTAAIFAATMSSTDTLFNWLGAVITKDVYVPISTSLKGDAPSEKTQLWFGKATVACLGVFSIFVAFNIKRFGGAFDVYMKAESLYKITLFIPVFFGLLYTKTPWWSAIASVSAGVIGVLGVGIAAAMGAADGFSVMNILFADLNVVWLGFELSRYELNAIVGILTSGSVFLASAFFDKREGAFKTSIESLETDLKTPAHAAVDAKIGSEGLIAYRLLGYLSILIGVVLFLVTFLTIDRNGWLNSLAGLIAAVIGITILKAVRSYERRHLAPPPAPVQP
ncbi:sodium:solute symporter family protein [Pelagicoccus sp. SDUM812005]|uniref:sodium:solute symporter family protein n=1 Tax=Pelagicoccus sp. SDUM812005 TaxID=3041257 RepID=UPI00280E359B|nr:sodium:solute symporter family protein [Pelagicoccus sp. SDUM812005]MDQ8183112.1 Na+:solute symporter [Pelagicoccus sp. SDUM812005]